MPRLIQTFMPDELERLEAQNKPKEWIPTARGPMVLEPDGIDIHTPSIKDWFSRGALRYLLGQLKRKVEDTQRGPVYVQGGKRHWRQGHKH